VADTVLIVGSNAGPVREAIETHGFESMQVPASDGPGAPGGADVRAVVLTLGANGSPVQEMAPFLRNGTRAPPLIVVLGTPDPAQKDRCLIGGAHDVSVNGQPDDVAMRVDAAIHGWLRAVPRRNLPTVFRAQRAREFYDLNVIDIDPSGFSIQPMEGLPVGTLLRVYMTLPDGPLTVWGRVSVSDATVGVRLLAMLPHERLRLVNAIRASAPGDSTDKTQITAPTSVAPPISLPTPSEATPGGRMLVESETTAPQSIPESPRSGTGALAAADDEITAPRSVEPPRRDASIPAAGEAPASLEPPSEREQPDNTAQAPTELEAAPVRAPAGGTPPPSRTPPPAAEPPVSKPPEELATEPPPSALDVSGPDSEMEAALALVADVAATAERRSPEALPEAQAWPPTIYDAEASTVGLRDALMVGLVSETAGAPAGDQILEFVRTLSIVEQRAFDGAPPPELPDQGVAIKALALRLRLFVLKREADIAWSETGTATLVDDAGLSKLTAEIKAVNAELQKIIDGLLAKAQTKRIKEVNNFRNLLSRAHQDLRDAVSRFKGEESSRSNPALLNVRELTPGAEEALNSSRGPKGAKSQARGSVAPSKAPKSGALGSKAPGRPPSVAAEKAPGTVPGAASFQGPPPRRSSRRLAVMVVLVAVSGAVAIATYRPPSALLGPQELAGLPDVSRVRLSAAQHRAFIVVTSAWKPDTNHLSAIDGFATKHKLESFRIENERGSAIASKSEGKKLVVFGAQPPK
jgi:hypothetical protein